MRPGVSNQGLVYAIFVLRLKFYVKLFKLLVSLVLLSASYIYSITYEMDYLNTGARRLCGAGGQ